MRMNPTKIFKYLINLLFFIGISGAVYSQTYEQGINLWYGNSQIFGNSGVSQPFINILGEVESPEELYALSYHYKGKRYPLPVGPTAFRLASPGSFNIEIDRTELLPGEHNLRIIAIYKDGSIIKQPVSFILKERLTDLPIKIDWKTCKDIQEVVQVVDGEWELTKSGLRVKNFGYDRAVALGDASWRDYEVMMEFIIHSITSDSLCFGWPSMGAAMHVAVRWQGHEDWGDIYPRRGWTGFGALFSYQIQKSKSEKLIWTYDRFSEKSIKQTLPYQLAFNETYLLKAQVFSRLDETTIYRMKIWKKSEQEPIGWEIQSEGTAGEPDKGSVLLVAHQSEISFVNISVKNME